MTAEINFSVLKAYFLYTIQLLFAISMLTSCASYKKNIMFKVPEGYALAKATQQAEQNYIIQKNDYLDLSVYTNSGERIIDPDLELIKDIPNQSRNFREELQYLVDIQGIAKLPMVGPIHLEGLTIRDAETLLQKEFAKFYTDPYVVLTYKNKRVIVLGAPGGLLVPLVDENVRLLEVLALSKAIDNYANAQNIRVLRGEEVFLFDLSTIEGYKSSNLIMKPGDVVYVEPIRRPVSEALRDYSGILSILATLTTLIVVITSVK